VREAYAAALEALFREYPEDKWHRLMDRKDALDYAERGYLVQARNYARSGGIPEDRLTVLEALLL
jgi:gamma-glutamyltranspeptidase